MTRTVFNSRRSRTSCSILALATVLTVGATPAVAKGLNGTGTFATNGTGASIANTATTTTVNLKSGNTVINWAPDDNAINNNVAIDFQTAGTTAIFTTDNTGGGNFAVLNKIGVADTSRVVSMSGTVNGVVAGDTGGSIYFYSPSGFIINSGATFNVASLVLSAVPISNVEFGHVGSTGYGTVKFDPTAVLPGESAPNPNASITMNGTVNAFVPPPVGVPIPGGKGYLAMVAPKVVHNGTATVDGSTALVGAEGATITFSADMLFNIQVDVGTTSTSGVEVNGRIGGPTPLGATDQQRIFLVAVPKNDALTMAIGNNADLGFTLANTAVDDNGVIVLSAGNNITAGAIGAKSAANGAGSTANISFAGARARNNVVAAATGAANFTSDATHLTTTLNNGLTVNAGSISVGSSGAGATLSIAKNVSLSTNRVGGTGQSVTAGDVSLTAQGGGALTVGGSIGISANATGGDASTGTAGSGTGGTINIAASGGSTLNLASLTTTATGTGGNATALGVNGGAGTGGTFNITADSGGTINFGAQTFDGQGFGGSGGGAGNGGAGTGGHSNISVGTNGHLTFGGDLLVDLDGFGGGSGSGTGGLGKGGDAGIFSTNSTTGGLISFNGAIEQSADGFGGESNSGTGGAGQGGTAYLTATADHFVFAAGANFHALGQGGFSFTGTGGSGTGGGASINATKIAGTAGEVDITGIVYLDSSGEGGDGAVGGIGTGGTTTLASQGDVDLNDYAFLYANGQGGGGFDGIGGLGTGGTINVTADGGLLTTSYVYSNASAHGGETDANGTFSGNGQGGTINIQALANGTLSLGDYVDAYADGFGGDVLGASTSGNGTGGTINLKATGANAAVTVAQNAYLHANGEAGGAGDCIACGAGGDGKGGNIYVTANGTKATLHVIGNVNEYADGYGGSPADGGTGGKGTGGFAQLAAFDGGSVDVDNSVYLEADGHGGGGYGADFATGGDGFGGAVEILTFGTGSPGLNIDGSANITASGYGGDFFIFGGGTGNIGGDGTGGRAGVYGNAGTLTIHQSLYEAANGYGGDGSVNGDGGVGGNGFGKDSELVATNGATVTVDGSATVVADGYGGRGDTGGNGTGGGIYDPATATGTDGAHIYAQNGSIILGGADVSADGYGGDAGYYYGGGTGGNGGDGSGGWATIHAANSNSGPSSITIQGVESTAYVSADGYGGDGDIGLDGTGGLDGLPGSDGLTGGIGGTGDNGGDGGAGGSGGIGHGGFAAATAAAGNGTLTIDSLYITAIGDGGSGGAGGSGGYGGTGGAGGAGSTGVGGTGGTGGNGGVGGNGGAGGAGIGGTITFGTESGAPQATASGDGVATFGNVRADATAYGGRGGSAGNGGSAGAGGSGGLGTPNGGTGNSGNFGVDGIGGDGGDATGGSVLLLVRGSTVNINGEADMYADAHGGDGGYGGDTGVDGNGGDAIVGGAGGISVLVTPRYLLPAQHGTLNAGAIYGSAVATGGNGLVDGVGSSLGANFVSFVNATADIGSLDFTVGADGLGGGAAPDSISIVGSTVDVDSFSFQTVGDLSLYVDDGAFNVGTLTLGAGNFVFDGRTPADLGMTTADTVNITTGGDFVANTNWDVTNTFVVDAPGLIALDNIHDDNGVDFTAGGSITLPSIDAGTYVSLQAGGDIDTGDILSGSSVFEQSAGGSITFGDIDATGMVNLNADSFISGGDISTGGSILAQAANGDIDLGTLTSTFGGASLDAGNDINLTGDVHTDGDIDLTAGGLIAMKNAVTHQSIDIDAVGNVNALNLTAGDTIEVASDANVTVGNLSAGIVNPSFNSDAEYNVGVLAGGNISAGNIEAAENIGLAAQGTATTGTIDAGNAFLALVHGNMSFGNIDAGSAVYLADYSMMALGGEITGNFDPQPIFVATPVKTGGSITAGNINAGSFTAAAGTNLTIGMLNADNGITLDAGAAITTGDLNVGDFVLANGGSITTGDIDAFSVNMTSTGGDISTGDIDAFGAVSLDAFADIITGDILAGSIDLVAGDDITTGDLTTRFPPIFLLQGGIHALSFPGASISLDAGGDISTGNISSIDGVWANAGGSLTTGLIDAFDFVELHSGGNMLTDDIDAGGYLSADAGGTMTLGDIASGYDADLASVGNMAFGDADIGDAFDFDSDASVTGGNVVAGNEITGGAGGTINLGNLTAGLSLEDGFSIGIGAIGNITVGNVTGTGPVGFASQGNLVTGNVSAGQLFMTLVGGNVTTGSITTTGLGSEVYMADDSMFFANGGTISGADDLDVLAVLEQAPTATGGSITINGPVNTGLFRAAAGTGLTTQAITAGDIRASAGGTATINGLWNSSDEVTLTSNDIDIASTGGIHGGGFVTLASSNALQMLVGDGFTGSGYSLSNAEFGRVSGEQIRLVGRGDASAALDMLVGDLSVSGSQLGGVESDGVLVFAVGDAQTQTPSGVIRVVGDVNATGFDSSKFIEFYATRFELDAALGSIGMVSSGSNLAGELGIYADRVHVAAGSILDKLAANPTYTNYQQDLNNAATGTTVHPEGVIRADTLWIESDNLADVLIQNTGTSGSGGTPAGFLVRQAFINDDFDTAGPAGSINLIVNGQLVTDGGTVTGVAARDALVPEGTDITPFTSNSTINGCPLTGACVIRPPAPPPVSNVVDNQIELITNNPLGDSDFGNEPDIDDNQEGDDGASNPISPPQPLFDTRPLIPSGDVNDPVSGTGNPALLGGDDQCDENEQGQCPNPVKGDGQ